MCVVELSRLCEVNEGCEVLPLELLISPLQSEDEALAQAIAASMSDGAPPSSTPHPTPSPQAQTHSQHSQTSLYVVEKYSVMYI